MSHPKRNVQRKLPRLVKYGIIASAICALVAVVLVALWSQQPLAQSALQEKQSEQVAESASLAPNESLTSDEAMPELSMKSRRDEGEMDESEGEREAPEVDNEVPSQQSSSLQQFDVADSGEQGPRIPAGQGESSKPTETHLTKASTYNGDLRDLPYVKPAKQEQPEREGPVPNPIGSPDSNTSSAEIPLAPIGPSVPAPAPLTTFDGLDYATWGAGHPPDTNGDVGSTYYIQTVNTSIGIYNKATSTRVAAFTFNTFMSQGSFGNLCDTDNYGDPVVMYDSFEDRWIISDFAFTVDASGNVINPPGSFQCIAVSRSGDPVTGGWYFYSINTTGGLGDYPKFGVWPDGIYMSANMFDYAAAGTFQNARVYAFNKAQMYAGIANPQVVTFNAPSTEFTLLPANARLQTGTPPAGSPNYFAVVWQYLNRVSVYKFHVDWNSISSSTFTGPFDSTTTTWWAQFSRGGATTAPTPANALDTLYPRLMMQNQYTNIGGVESLWATHTAGAGNPTSNTTSAQAAVRYYQVRITGGTVEATANQAYTYSPDTTMYRFMPSVAIDRLGDLAIGYTTANTTTNPALKYAGRLYTDTLNTISQSEQTLYQGTGSQSGNCGGAACIRWGDYSAMTLDPDGCTFWYTNEYYTTTGLNDLTRIGSFRYPSCAPVSGSGAVTGTVIDAGSGNPLSGAAVVMGSRITTTNASGVYQFTNLPAGVYPNVTASYLGYTTGFAGPITITAGLTTTQNLALNPAPTSDCFVDTTQADFQTGVATNCDLNSSPGNVTLLNAPFLDQQNTNLTTYVGFNNTAWAGQTFQSPYTGQLVQVDLYLYCDVCTGTPPNITVSIRNTTGNLPTGADLATATVSNFTTSSDGFLSAVFAAPPTLTAGTRYAIILRAASAYTNGTLYYTRSTGSVYANGRQVTSANSGGTWAGAANDIGFKTYMRTGYATSGNFVSGVKDANPAAGYAPRWGTLAWNATAPTGTTIQFQAAGSNNVNGPFNFVGPDSTTGTYFTNGGTLNQFDGLRYLKYKAYLTTTNTTQTPVLADVTLCYTDTLIVTPTVMLISSQNPSLISQTVTFTANVSSGTGVPTGQVQFRDNGAILGAVQALNNGNATFSTAALTVGTHTITATYQGSALFYASSGLLTPDQVVTSTVTWNGSTNTDWFTAANWNPSAVPTIPANVIIPTSPSGNRWPIISGAATINDLTVQSSAMLTISQGVTLFVNGAMSSNGALAQIKDVPASTTTEFLHITNAAGTTDKYHGVDLTPGSTAMGVTTVQVKGNQTACTTNASDQIIHRCYWIDPTTQTAATARFWFTNAELNLQPANALRLWHWGPWTQVGTAANYSYSESGTTCTSGSGLACWFQSTGVSSYSPFVLGSGAGPTALHETMIEAHNDAWVPILAIAALALAGMSLGLVMVKRRRA